MKLKELPPVVTNLGNPQTVWVRLQAAIVYDERSISNLDILVSQLRSDIVAFLRVTSLASIQGADGLRRLHEELSDRASIRSEKQVKEFIIETIIIMKKALVLVFLLFAPSVAVAQNLDLNSLLPAGSATASGKIIQILVVLTVLSVAPGLLIMVTSFTRFVIALSFLRSGLGLQSTPANLVLISLALFMTFYVMTPTFAGVGDRSEAADGQ